MPFGRMIVSRSFGQSLLIGSLLGTSIWMLPQALTSGMPLAEAWLVPLLGLTISAVALPFVATGLIVFGLPATLVLQRHAKAPWIGLAAALWGAVAGKVVFALINNLLFFGLNNPPVFSLNDIGVFYGVPTGIAWCLLQGRALSDGDPVRSGPRGPAG